MASTAGRGVEASRASFHHFGRTASFGTGHSPATPSWEHEPTHYLIGSPLSGVGRRTSK